MILGIDEVGRGAWAGPLVVGACVLDNSTKIDRLTDSKRITAAQREELEPIIKEKALAYGLGWVAPVEIDQMGLASALRLASQRAISQINPKFYRRIIIDGTVDFLDSPMVTVMKQADLLVPSVSAAAVLAKVARDHFMAELDGQTKYAKYEFARHVGYGTKRHREALEKYGACDLHRRSFKPVAKIVGDYELPQPNQSGKTGEATARDWLESKGFTVLAQNWRTKLFEVDLVVVKDDMLGVIEVKTRRDSKFGGGLAAVNIDKLKKLQRASQVVLQKPEYQDYRIQIGIITVYETPESSSVDELIWLDE